jgi:medium-chain acyl-[acyl-carrier-protein] hydrolase
MKINAATPDRLWYAEPRPGARGARVRLFCFPYAGGSALIFRQWTELLPPAVEVRAAHLPGRGARLRERPFEDVHSLVEAILPVMAGQLDRPFALFGHSMGGAIAFELSRRLRATLGVEPRRLFISGRGAPHLAETTRPIYDLPDEEFKEELRRLNGTPAEVLDHPELIEMLLPMLRADITLSQTYKCESRPSLSCPLTVFGGLDDTHDEPEALEAWREHTTGPFKRLMFEGDHFFVNTARHPLLREVGAALLADLGAS